MYSLYIFCTFLVDKPHAVWYNICVVGVLECNTQVYFKGCSMFGFGRKTIKKNELDNGRWQRIFTQVLKHEQKEIKAYDKFVKWFKDGYIGNQRQTEANACFTFSRVQILLALLYGNDPYISVSPNPKGAGSEQSFAPLVMAGLIPTLTDAKREFAETIQGVMEYSYREADVKTHNMAALFEAAVRGLGITKTTFDAKRGIPRVDCIKRSEFYADPEARYTIDQGDYVIQTSSMGIERARRFFDKFGVAPQDIQPNYSAAQDKAMGGSDDESDGELDMFRFHEVWLKEGDDRLLLYRDQVNNQWIGDKMEWPYTLDEDEFTYETITFARQYQQVADAFTALHVIQGLSKTYDEMIESMLKKARRSVARKVIYDPDRIDDEQLEQLHSTRDMEWIPVKAKEGRINDAFHIVELNAEHDVTPEAAASAKAIADEMYGTDEMQRGGEARGRMSASEASIRDENSKLRSNAMQNNVDDWQAKQLRHRIQICRQLTPPETVGMVAGQLGAMLWAMHAGSGKDITAEYSIVVQAGSSGARAKEMRSENLKTEFESGVAINEAAMGLPVIDLVGIHKSLAREGGSLEPDRFVNKELAALYLSGQLLIPPAAPAEEQYVEGQPQAGYAEQSPGGYAPGGEEVPVYSGGEQAQSGY